uniref:Uncharacterized protein n=1 Tax=Tanacetum cinerariifolium TaxID=118510 RepID=A0A6L2JXQ0_TANCI|nr:hypothetical protein [Tanacetum cinerariifolium]
MANLTFVDSDNMVAYLEKSTENADFAEIVDFLNASPIRYALTYSKPENPNELFQKLLGDLKELADYDNSPSKDYPIFLNDNEEHSVQNEESLENSSNETAVSSSDQEKEEPPQDSDIRKLIREECCVKVCDEQKQSMEDTMLELVKICQQKELMCIHDNVDDLNESALNSKLLLISSQRLEKEQQEVKNVIEQPVKRGNRNIQSLQNFRIVHKSPISLNNTSQISSIHAVATILSTKEPEYSSSMGYEHSNTTPEMKSDEIIKSGVEELVPILSKYEIVSIEEENDVNQEEEEEVDLENISQIQDVVLREKLLIITRLISNIEYLNDNPTSDRVLNSFESDNFLSDNFSPEFETFCDHTEETRSGNTTHDDNSLPEYDSFCFEIEPDQERLINVVKSDISDDSSNDPLLEEADLFLASNNLIPSGIQNVADDSEGDIHFLEELLIDDSILSHESPNSNFEDNASFPQPPSKPPDAETDAGEEIPVIMNDKDKFDEDYYFFMFDKVFSFLSAESEDTIFDPEEIQEVGKEKKAKNSTPQEEGRYGHDIEVNTASTSITTASINITTVEPVTTVSAPVTTADVSTLIKIRSEKSKEKGSKEKSSETATKPTRGVIMKEASETTTRLTLPHQKQLDLKDKDHELAERLQAEEQGELTIKERLKLFVELMNERKKHFARLRAEEKTRKPTTKAQKRNQMCTYLKNMAGFTHNQLKNKSFKEVQKDFDKTMS